MKPLQSGTTNACASYVKKNAILLSVIIAMAIVSGGLAAALGFILSALSILIF